MKAPWRVPCRTAGAILALWSLSAGAETMTVGYQGRVMDTAVGRGDIRIAVELWAREVTAHMDIHVEPQIRFFDHAEQVETALANEEVDVLSLSSVDFLRLREGGLSPTLVSVIGDSWELGYVALTRVTEDIDGIEALAGRRIVVVDPVRRSCLPTLWLEHAVHRVAARQPAAFFAEVTHVQDPSPAILSVLFGKIDAAVVSRRAFETMAELNPQVRRELAVVAESPGLLPAVTCIPAYVAVDRRDDIIEGALRLHEYPKGRQILTLFGTSQVIPFRDEYLQAVAGLVAQDWKD